MSQISPSAPAGPSFKDYHADAETIGALRHDAESCTRCDLYSNATQLVFGEGSAEAEIMLVGEQPGDKEDLAGRPFVGPAGLLLDTCLEKAGIERTRCYVTNAVKHFKHEMRGKKRLHARPNAGEVQRCSWWLGAELEVVKAKLVVALGATAAASLLGPKIRIMRDRGTIVRPQGQPSILITIHPSALLRIRDSAEKDAGIRAFVADLRKIPAFLGH
jgi:DNA polymerase